MDIKKVLFLTWCYPPQNYPRSIQIGHLVQFLQKKISLEVITFAQDNICDQSLLSFTLVGNVQRIKQSRMNKFIDCLKGDKIKKTIFPDIYYFWHLDLYKKAYHAIKSSGTDLIVTFGQPMSMHIAGLKLKKKFPNLKWIAHFSDPWVDNIFNKYNKWLKFINQYYQNAVFTLADKLIFTSQETIKLIAKQYPYAISSKALCLPHCFNESLYVNHKQRNTTFTIRYLGNFYGNRQPDCLFKALSIIQKEKKLENVRFELIGSITSAIDASIKFYELETIVFTRSCVNYIESLKLMKDSDLLLIIDAPIDSSPFLPSKLIDYIGANKPIFGITPIGTSQQLIEEMGFVVANPNNPQEIAKKLCNMINAIRFGQMFDITEHIRNRYSNNVVGQQMYNVLKNII